MKDSETTHTVDDVAAAFSLIDVSASDDDFLLASSSDVTTVGNRDEILARGGNTNQASDSTELGKSRKFGKCNLRKSLAWDSAFFTNAGVLDPEELCSIIEGTETSVKQKHFLPGIEEDLSKSYDSVSTFESDNLTIESLEADLFCDIRASIQRISRPSAQGNCSSFEMQRETESTNGSSTKTSENTSGNMVKPKLASKKPTAGVHGPSRTLKPGPISRQVAKPAFRNTESKLLLPRPAEAAVKPNLIGAAATKKTSIFAGRAKLESTTARNPKGKVASFSKGSYQVNSSNTVPRTLASSKLSSGSSVLGRAAAVRSSHSSCDSSSSSSSETLCKSECDANRRKMEKKTNLPSGSKIRAPSRVAVKSKCRSGDSHLSDYLKSTSKLSASISPTSSISEWSTESSSSTVTINQKLIGLTPCLTSTEDSTMDSNVPQSQSHSTDSASSGHENQLAGLDQSAKQPSTAVGVSLSRPGSAKPSGLRMPSAKLGFFDGVKAAAKTPSSGSRSRPALPSNLPRSGALNGRPSVAANNPKAAVKLEPCRADMNLKPVQLDDCSTGPPNILNTANVELHSEASSKVSKHGSLDPTLEECGEVLNGGKCVADSGSEVADDINLAGAKEDASLDGKLQLPTKQATSAAEDLHNAIHITDGIKDLSANPSSDEVPSDKKEYSDMDGVRPSQEVGESDSLKISIIHACQDIGESVGQGPGDGNQDSGYGAIDVMQNGQAKQQVDGFGAQTEATTNEMEMQSKSNGTFKSKNLINEDNSLSILSHREKLCDEKPSQSANLSSGSLSFLCGGASPGTRTPFASKNSVAHLIEIYNSSSGPAMEASVKFDTVPSLVEEQKENC